MLDANENKWRQDKELKKWAEEQCLKQNISTEKFCEDHLIPNILLFEDFEDFISKRKGILINKLKSI